jgi:choline-sulfatase
MPWTGYPRPIAPNLTKLAEKSVVLSHAYALSSYTSMSLGGLFAARYPSELVRDGHATSSFGPENVMLAEVLHDAGIRTIGIGGHVYFQGATGISQGFDDWRLPPKITSRPARDGFVVDDELADLVIAALGDHERDHPSQRFFAWVHFMDPHFSYAHHPGYPRFRGNAGAPLSDVGQARRNAYDGEVVFTDAQIGRVLAWLEQQPFAKKTAVIVSADHGEAFGEHKSYFEHGYALWDVTTRVPLFFWLPAAKPARLDTRRSQIDLARTILELMNVKAPDCMRGESLVAELRGARPPERDVVIDMPYTDQTPRRRALIHGHEKIVVTETEPAPELFDLDADPGEQHDLAASEPARLAAMKKLWDELDARFPDYPAPRRSSHSY